MPYQIWVIGLNKDQTMPSVPLVEDKIAEAETREDAIRLFDELSSSFINVSEPYIEMLLEKVRETEDGEECEEIVKSCTIPHISELGLIKCQH